MSNLASRLDKSSNQQTSVSLGSFLFGIFRKCSILNVYLVLYLILLYSPVLLLPLFSFNDSVSPSLPLSGFTFKWYQGLLNNEVMLKALMNSMIVGISAASLSTILGICAARAIHRYRFRGKILASGLIMAPLVLPEIIVGVSLLLVLLSLGFELSLITVVLGHALICLPYSITILLSGFDGFDQSLEEAARDLGETSFGALMRVTLPMLFPALISSFLICFTISLDEFILAFFLSGTQPTLPVYIWGQLRFPAKLPEVMALGSIMLVVSLLMLSIAEIIRRRSMKKRGLNN